MRGDKLIIQEHHRRAAVEIVSHIVMHIQGRAIRYTITVAGESGSGKSETARAIADELERSGIKTVVLGQDDYFLLPPKSNDTRRRADPDWLGPHLEVKLGVLEQNLVDAIEGKRVLTKPLVDYDSNTIEDEVVNLEGIQVLIVEGTYVSLLRHVDSRVFICRTWLDTREDRLQRKRGTEAGDPFIEQVLRMEHKIIAGHQQLADILITKDHRVVVVEPQRVR
jgi:uridine kinase